MSNYKPVYLSAVVLTSVFLLVFVFNQRQDENPSLYYNSESETKQQLDTFEDRRCEGKLHKNPVPLELTHRQYSRKKLLYEQCNDYRNINISGKWTKFDEIPIKELNNLLVDDRHGIIYCYVPKVACTIWKRILIFLSESLKVHGVPYRSPAEIPIEHVHGSAPHHLNAYPNDVMKQKLETYQKFIFVRDPYVRLISGYRDKLEKENQVFYKIIGKKLLQEFQNVTNPPDSVHEAHARGTVPSFHNFIQYIVNFPERNYEDFDEHWQKIITMCHPCLINYDFIGKMETVDEDAAHLLRILKVDNIINWKRFSKTEPKEIKKWFSNIPIEWRRKLDNIYKGDLKFFGYKNHENLDDINPKNII